MSDSVLACRGLTRVYQSGPHEVAVFQSLDLQVPAGAQVAIVGTSGAGKSTLLHLMAGLDRPTSGSVEISGQDINDISERERSRVRNEWLGFVFQFHHLLHEFSALENVLMPIRIRRKPDLRDRERARAILADVGIADRALHKPSELSGGERQRVAIARALINEPRLVLMDEPTGNLDARTSEQIQGLIGSLNASSGSSFVIVTHNERLAQAMPTRYRLHGGELKPL